MFIVMLWWLVATTALVLALRPELRRRVVRVCREIRLWHVLTACWLGLVLISTVDTIGPGLLLAAILFVAVWMHELYVLMHASDTAFPGRYDKALWVLLLVIAAPVGVLLFHSFREANWSEKKAVYSEAVRDFL